MPISLPFSITGTERISRRRSSSITFCRESFGPTVAGSTLMQSRTLQKFFAFFIKLSAELAEHIHRRMNARLGQVPFLGLELFFVDFTLGVSLLQDLQRGHRTPMPALV